MDSFLFIYIILLYFVIDFDSDANFTWNFQSIWIEFLVNFRRLFETILNFDQNFLSNSNKMNWIHDVDQWKKLTHMHSVY